MDDYFFINICGKFILFCYLLNFIGQSDSIVYQNDFSFYYSELIIDQNNIMTDLFIYYVSFKV